MKKFLRSLLICAMVLTTVFSVSGCSLAMIGGILGNLGEKQSESSLDSSDEGGDNSSDEESDKDLADQYEHITIAEAVELAEKAGETPTKETYTIVGTIKTVHNSMYGEMTVEDETGELYIYGSMAEDGTYYDKMTDRPVKGDTIVLKGVLKTYSGTPQMAEKDVKAVILDWYHPEVEIDPSEYTSMSISAARDAEVGAKVQVSGVVAAIAYANGKIPTGIILVDDTASIYVFDKDVAGQVKMGNQITVAASKAYWVLSTEAENAALFGYKGACQLEGALLVSNDNGKHEFNKAWIEEITVKELMNKPFEENITTLLYKTTALVEKREGTGFVNYYIKDLDGKTGSYTYTQCNGSDFAWLDAYDGKICTVYLTALNAKSAPAECFYRFLPVQVGEVKDYSYPEKDIPAFAIEYSVVDLFSDDAYGANPALQLPNGYSNEILGVEGVALSYSISNDKVAQLVKGESVTTLNLIDSGSCDVTITATYKTYTATVKRTVTMEKSADILTPTVAEIIAMEDESHVQVRGVVMSSLVNRDGFYLGDDTGMIAVLTDGETLGKIKPGDEVVFEGYKVHYKKASSQSLAGQCAIVGSISKTQGDDGVEVHYTSDSKLLANYFGGKEYSTSYFIEGKTIDDLYTLDISKDYTNNVYKVKAMVVLEETAYYTNILLQDKGGKNKLRLYCSSANQYSWLKAYAGKEVELELAVCNWNDKNYYTGCVISATVDGVKTVNTLNFAK